MHVPFRDVDPARVVVVTRSLERCDPFLTLFDIEALVAIRVVEKDRPRVIADDVLHDLDALAVRERDEILVVLHPTIARIGISRGEPSNERREMRCGSISRKSCVQ